MLVCVMKDLWELQAASTRTIHKNCKNKLFTFGDESSNHPVTNDLGSKKGPGVPVLFIAKSSIIHLKCISLGICVFMSCHYICESCKEQPQPNISQGIALNKYFIETANLRPAATDVFICYFSQS